MLHVLGPEGNTEDVVYPIGDPNLGRHGLVYGVFLEVEPGETCVAVSRYGEGDTWSDSSRTQCFQHDEPELSACRRADLNQDGIVGGPDWTLFASSFGARCE